MTIETIAIVIVIYLIGLACGYIVGRVPHKPNTNYRNLGYYHGCKPDLSDGSGDAAEFTLSIEQTQPPLKKVYPETPTFDIPKEPYSIQVPVDTPTCVSIAEQSRMLNDVYNYFNQRPSPRIFSATGKWITPPYRDAVCLEHIEIGRLEGYDAKTGMVTIELLYPDIIQLVKEYQYHGIFKPKVITSLVKNKMGMTEQHIGLSLG